MKHNYRDELAHFNKLIDSFVRGERTLYFNAQ